MENAVPMVSLAPQSQAVTEIFHSITPEVPEVKEMSSVIIVLRVLWAREVHIIDRAAEAEAAALDIEFQQI